MAPGTSPIGASSAWILALTPLTARWHDVVTPRVWSRIAIRREPVLPHLVDYLELPGIDNQDELPAWYLHYSLVRTMTFARGGYVMTVRELRLRPGDAQR